MSGGVEYSEFIAHPDDEFLRLLFVRGVDLYPEELARPDRLYLLVKSGFVYQVA